MSKQNATKKVVRTKARETEILQRLANGETLTSICRDVGLKPSQVYGWTQSDEGFANRFARARDFGDMVLEDQAVDCSDGENIGEETVEVSNEKGTSFTRKKGDNVARSRLQAETRLKIVARRKGAKITNEIRWKKPSEAEMASEMTVEQLMQIAGMPNEQNDES